MSVKTEKEHYKRTEQFVKEIQNLYFEVAEYCANISKNYSLEEGIFTFKDHPVLNRKVDRIIDNMRKSMYATIVSGISKEWDKANENNDELVKRLLKKTNIPLKKYQTRNLDALEAFQERKIKGLKLSDRVWNYTNQFKGEIEQALDVGIADGRSAAQLSRDIREYLREPEKLFRRVRDKNGVLKASKNALRYNPGGGVYRSSYKNALRLTRTEINMAYRTADHLRWQQLDFVVGIEIRRSNHYYACDVCESLKGKYPKDFKFIGWHPNCRCHAIPILATEEELLDSIENGTPINSKNEVKGSPEQFEKWMKENEDRVVRAKTLPFFIQNNLQFVDSNTIKERSILELMEKAKSAETSVSSLSNSIAEKFGGYSTPVNFKSYDSIKRKANSDYNGNVNKIQDSIRTTIILDEKNIEKCLENIQKNTNFIRIKVQTPDKYMGYSATITNIKTNHGVIGEIQVNTAKMIYAKEKPNVAKSVLGEDVWNKIKKETGMQGGLGHKFYEEFRILDKNIPEQAKKMIEIEKRSREYYKHFR